MIDPLLAAVDAGKAAVAIVIAIPFKVFLHLAMMTFPNTIFYSSNFLALKHCHMLIAQLCPIQGF